MKKVILPVFVAFLISGSAIANERYILVRSPFDMISSFFDDVESELGFNYYTTSNSFSPAMNIIDNGQNLVVEMQVPGFSKDQIQIKVEPKSLVVTGKKEEKTEEQKEKYLKAEAISSSFVKETSLPVAVKVDQVTSNLSNGILKITLPKEEVVQPRLVEVEEN